MPNDNNTRVSFKRGTGSLPSVDNGSLVFSEDSGKIYLDTPNGRVEMLYDAARTMILDSDNDYSGTSSTRDQILEFINGSKRLSNLIVKGTTDDVASYSYTSKSEGDGIAFLEFVRLENNTIKRAFVSALTTEQVAQLLEALSLQTVNELVLYYVDYVSSSTGWDSSSDSFVISKSSYYIFFIEVEKDLASGGGVGKNLPYVGTTDSVPAQSFTASVTWKGFEFDSQSQDPWSGVAFVLGCEYIPSRINFTINTDTASHSITTMVRCAGYKIDHSIVLTNPVNLIFVYTGVYFDIINPWSAANFLEKDKDLLPLEDKTCKLPVVNDDGDVEIVDFINLLYINQLFDNPTSVTFVVDSSVASTYSIPFDSSISSSIKSFITSYSESTPEYVEDIMDVLETYNDGDVEVTEDELFVRPSDKDTDSQSLTYISVSDSDTAGVAGNVTQDYYGFLVYNLEIDSDNHVWKKIDNTKNCCLIFGGQYDNKSNVIIYSDVTDNTLYDPLCKRTNIFDSMYFEVIKYLDSKLVTANFTTGSGNVLSYSTTNNPPVSNIIFDSYKPLVVVGTGVQYVPYGHTLMNLSDLDSALPTSYAFSNYTFVHEVAGSTRYFSIAQINPSYVSTIKSIKSLSTDSDVLDLYATGMSNVFYNECHPVKQGSTISKGYHQEQGDGSNYYFYIECELDQSYVFDFSVSVVHHDDTSTLGLFTPCSISYLNGVAPLVSGERNPEYQAKLNQLAYCLNNHLDQVEVRVNGAKITSIINRDGTYILSYYVAHLYQFITGLVNDQNQWYIFGIYSQSSDSFDSISVSSDIFVSQTSVVYNDDNNTFSDVSDNGVSNMSNLFVQYFSDEDSKILFLIVKNSINIIYSSTLFKYSGTGNNSIFYKTEIIGSSYYLIFNNIKNAQSVPTGWYSLTWHNNNQDLICYKLIKEEVSHIFTVTPGQGSTACAIVGLDNRSYPTQEDYDFYFQDDFDPIANEVKDALYLAENILNQSIHNIELHIVDTTTPTIKYCAKIADHTGTTVRFETQVVKGTNEDKYYSLLIDYSGNTYTCSCNVYNLANDTTITNLSSLTTTVSTLSSIVNGKMDSMDIDASTGTLSDDDNHLPTSKLVASKIAEAIGNAIGGSY